MNGELITVDVTAEDIRLGWRANLESCAVARALKRATGNNFWYVHTNSVSLDGKLITLPLRVARWIDMFDFGVPVDPISFELQIPAHFETLPPAVETKAAAVKTIVQQKSTLELESLEAPQLVS